MFSDPEKNIEQFSVGADFKVADFGAGSGAYSFALAKKLGDDGRVYTLEVKKDLLSRISSEARDQNLYNIEVIWGDIETVGGTKLGDNSMNAVVAANVFFQIEDKKAAVQEIKRVLLLEGRVLVVDWIDSFGGLGPQVGNLVKESTIQDLFELAGFSFERSIDAGAHHYGLIFKKSS